MIFSASRAFNTNSNIAICTALAVITISFTTIFLVHNKEITIFQGFQESFGLVLTCLAQRGSELDFDSVSLRLLTSTVWWLSFVLFAHYSALLTSAMTAGEKAPAIEQFSDVVIVCFDMID